MTQEQKIIYEIAYIRGILNAMFNMSPKDFESFTAVLDNLTEYFDCLQEDVLKALGIETGVKMP